jgi:hypothetical protein
MDLLKEGIVWRVGSGEEIDVWQDPWIPRGSTRRVQTPNEMDEHLLVFDLIDQSTGQWDEEVLRAIFVQEDVDDILQIPVRHGMEDTVAWHFDKKGVFSVKSAYRLGIDLRDHQRVRDASSSTSPSHEPPFWAKIWNLKLPAKVRIFIWRLSHNSLPLRMNIKRKKIDLDTRCPMCYRVDEDGGHLFLKCKKVKQIWRQSLLEDVRITLAEAPNPMAMFDTICALPKEKRDHVLILLWDWWTTRNKVNAGEMERSPEVVCGIINRHRVDFRKNTTVNIFSEGDASTVPHPSTIVWKKPPSEWVKINFDASFVESSRSGAWGFVARSDSGNFLQLRQAN